MVDIIVQRGNGDWPGQDIVEPLLADTGAAIARGRSEIDEATPHDAVSLTIRYTPAIRTGQLYQIADAQQGRTWRGKVVSWRHQNEDGYPVTVIEVKRPAP